ncbi:MAG: sigma-54-dependent Fis family transcriptional regulator [bacterium]|nr:sigma-54-dependent Fis family transcriptional regulator [bacterium]
MIPIRILLVDDDLAFRKSTSKLLESDECIVETAASGEAALARFTEVRFDVVLCDLVMQGLSGLELLPKLREIDSRVPILMITGHGSIDSAIGAMKAGAADYVTKPFNSDELRMRIARVVEHERQRHELATLQEEIASRSTFARMIGRSRAMEDVFHLARKVARTDTTVLILGETGTGKGILAQALHSESKRAKKPYVSVNCAALTPTLLESELFGHEKGAFTGAVERRIGRFELADGGTLFLDEIGELTPELQTKLLNVVQERQFERVGGSQTLSVNVRLITATNHNLAEQVRAGRFREDLYYRLNVVPITLPPLRARREDIELLAADALATASERLGKPGLRFSVAAWRALLEHEWPGNVRELQNTVERAVVLAESNEIERIQFIEVAAISSATPIATDRPLRDLVRDETERVERQYLAALLARYRGNIGKTADHAGIDRRTIFEKLKQFDLHKEDYK